MLSLGVLCSLQCFSKLQTGTSKYTINHQHELKDVIVLVMLKTWQFSFKDWKLVHLAVPPVSGSV